MLKLIKKFREDEEGASLIEYSLLVGLISVVIVASIVAISTNLKTIWSTLASVMGQAAG
ncbi:MAG: Flp family type IVb pilin [Pseudomonadota bacterium]